MHIKTDFVLRMSLAKEKWGRKSIIPIMTILTYTFIIQSQNFVYNLHVIKSVKS